MSIRVSKKRFYLTAISTMVVGILIGWLIFGGQSSDSAKDHKHTSETVNQIWTCSMHPSIRKTEPGDCPICGMDLIPLSEDDNGSENPNAIKMSPTAMQLANVQTAIVSSGKAVKALNLTGKIVPDERAIYTQTTHFSGRVEQLKVNFEGEAVQKGQVVAVLYSPELVTAQEELLIAKENQATQPQLLTAAKEKLRNWKLNDGQIEQLMNADKVQQEFPLLADYSGTVINLMVEKGDYAKTGKALYEVVDLSKLWVELDIHENNIAWVNEGDEINFSVRALPNQNFSGEVSFIDPVINPQTRVAKARIEIDNAKRILKPEMLVNAEIQSTLASSTDQLIVPKSAVMWTGERSIVYVKTKVNNGLHFIMREVELGASLGDAYVIVEGLKEGEEIAVNGTFSIDAAAQLAGKPSMMNPEGGGVTMGHNHGEMSGMQGSHSTMNEAKSTISMSTEAKQELRELFENYFELKNALVADDYETASQASKDLQEKLKTIEMNLFKGEAHAIWMKLAPQLEKANTKGMIASNIKDLRTAFIAISKFIIELNQRFQPMTYPTYVQHCPMVNNNQGADWLSKEKEIRNPYFGSSMLNCGKLKL